MDVLILGVNGFIGSHLTKEILERTDWTVHGMDLESDRIASCVAAVIDVGGRAEPREDGFVVYGQPLAGGTVKVGGDHRIALAFGVLGLAVPGVVLSGAEAVSKSYPGFFDELARAGGVKVPLEIGQIRSWGLFIRLVSHRTTVYAHFAARSLRR